MEPPAVRYAKTEDGLAVAYAAVGRGEPIVVAAYSLLPLPSAWEFPVYAGMIEALAANHRVVLYDQRGTGMSQQGLVQWSHDDDVKDFRAVLKEARIDRCALLGHSHGGPKAIRIAATMPGAISHLMLWSTWLKASDAFTEGRAG